MKTLSTLLFALLAISAGSVHAAAADEHHKAYAGRLVCGGNHFVRASGTEMHFTAYVLRNLDDEGAIRIERIRLVDASGATLADFTAPRLPPFRNGLLGPGDDTLAPGQSGILRTLDLVGLDGLPRSRRPLQLIVEWRAGDRALTLDAVAVHIARERRTVTGADGLPAVTLGSERSRHLNPCRTVYRQRWQ